MAGMVPQVRHQLSNELLVLALTLEPIPSRRIEMIPTHGLEMLILTSALLDPSNGQCCECSNRMLVSLLCSTLSLSQKVLRRSKVIP